MVEHVHMTALIPSGVQALILLLKLVCAGVILWRYRFRFVSYAATLGLLILALADLIDILKVTLGYLLELEVIYLYGWWIEVTVGGLLVLGALFFTAGLLSLGMASYRDYGEA